MLQALGQKLGHIKIECYKFRNKNRRIAGCNERTIADASVAENKGDDLLLVSIVERSKLISGWIMDSGCSYHMCPNKD